MKTRLTILTLAGTAALIAAPRSSTDYGIGAEIADAGGGLSASVSYEHHGSFHSMNGASTAGATFGVLHGYLGQISTSSPPPAAFAAWQAANFADPEAPDAAPLADPDEDGLGNVAEYAWGLNPNEPGQPLFDPGTGSPGLPVMSLDVTTGGALTIVMPQRSDGSVAYVLERATDLSDWQPVTPAADPPVTIDATWEQATLVLADPAADPRSQYRIVATLR
jgi:hypothetical protein